MAGAIDPLLDDAPCGFVGFDDDGIVVLANATLAGWLGHPVAQVVGRPLAQLLAPGGVIFHQTHFFPMLKMRGRVDETYLSLRTASGEEFPVLANACRRAHGEGMRNDCVLVPMRNRHRFEDELLRARRAAEAARDARARFLSMLAHEVRTPLTAITGLAHVLLAGTHGALQPEQREDVATILRAGDDVDRLIADVLRLARAEAGQDAGERMSLPLEDALLRVEEQMRARWQARDLDYRRAPSPCALVVRADAQRLHQILLNLLSNAAKFTPRGGRVEVACHADEDARRIRIEVRDSGGGIPDAEIERIFEPFFQSAQANRSPDLPGVGLGLAISREFADAMEGSLLARNAPGGGAVFVLELPGG